MSDAESTLPKPFVFVLMPFDPKFHDTYKFGIKDAAVSVGAYAERLDEQIFSEGMLERVFNQISKADVTVADMTGRNPNVFYEVGYAHALNKIVVLLTQNADDIPFDLRHRQHTVYGGQIDTLRSELVPKLRWAIAESQNRAKSPVAEGLSISISGLELCSTAEVREEGAPVLSVQAHRGEFVLALQVRNDSSHPVEPTSHVYLLSSGDKLHPCSFVPNYGNVRIESLRVSPRDSGVGFSRLFRLNASFSSLPPGAVEEAIVPMEFANGVTGVTERFRLRIHTRRRFVDYPFQIAATAE
jgi:hypothetical protein